MFKRTIATIFFSFLITFPLLSVSASTENSQESPTVDQWLKGEHEDSNNTETFNVEESNEGMTLTVLKMLAALFFVLLVIYALAKFVNKRTKPFFGNRGIETIGGVPVGNQRSVQLVKIGEKILVIGVGESVQLLKEISDKKEVEALLQEKTDVVGYEHVISKVKQQFQHKTSASRSYFSTILDQQLKQMSQNRKTFFSNAVKKESNDE